MASFCVPPKIALAGRCSKGTNRLRRSCQSLHGVPCWLVPDAQVQQASAGASSQDSGPSNCWFFPVDFPSAPREMGTLKTARFFQAAFSVLSRVFPPPHQGWERGQGVLPEHAAAFRHLRPPAGAGAQTDRAEQTTRRLSRADAAWIASCCFAVLGVSFKGPGAFSHSGYFFGF